MPLTVSDLTFGTPLEGVEPNRIVSVVHAQPAGESVTLFYQRADGSSANRLLSAEELETLKIPTAQRPWRFDAPGHLFQLLTEAKRIDLAFLFDPMMAVHTANVTPLPHQITAVYEAMLPRQPLRFVLADDPGAGKTVMAGLLVRELDLRGDAKRVLVVAPGSLVEQWRDELWSKFGLQFSVHASNAPESSGNFFEEHHQVIARLDLLARREDLHEALVAEPWDLVIFDEAHKLAAHFQGQEVKETARFKLAKHLGAHTRHLLLMTATPHAGKEEDFQLFLSLLDSDRFYGKFRDGVHKVDTSDLMRRMVKEDLLTFEGKKLFPERVAQTANYALSPLEARLYEKVTAYVRDQFDRADSIQDGRRRGSVGFALTTLQRRLASSPEAIFQSLRRRRERLEAELHEVRLNARAQESGSHFRTTLPELRIADDGDDDDLTAEEQEALEEALVSDASASLTRSDLEAEVLVLKALEGIAFDVANSGQDRKWDELSRLLQDEPEMRDSTGARRKIILFTEHRATLDYLVRKIGNLLGDPNAVLQIHGGTHRDERKGAQERFRSDPGALVLVATDAAGEGVNLQCASLMINYDLPWNPNRLEQRFGRIHRIGQRQVCFLWNLVAHETREGEVYKRLLDKLAIEREALGGRVFDILGQVFEQVRLKDLLLEAIRYGESPEKRAELDRRVGSVLDREKLQGILRESALAHEALTPEHLFEVRRQMELAEARKLQPYFVRAFFLRAFHELGGTVHKREADRLEVTHVPAVLREADRRVSGRNARETAPVQLRYHRICFTKEAVAPEHVAGAQAALVHPGHPLMLAMVHTLEERHGHLLRQGAVLLDARDAGTTPSLVLLLRHRVDEANGKPVSQRIQFVRLFEDGRAEEAGAAPHLDLQALGDADRALVRPLLEAPWVSADLEAKAVALAAERIAPEHFREVAERRKSHARRTHEAVHKRLTTEIVHQQNRHAKLLEDRDAKKEVRLNLEITVRVIRELQERIETRSRELFQAEHVVSRTPTVLGAAFVVPAGLLARLRGEAPAPGAVAADEAARRAVELAAMRAVTRAEESRGFTVRDVSAQKCGWDLESTRRDDDGREERFFLEVKGRVEGAGVVMITKNEVISALNRPEQWRLAVVKVLAGGEVEGPFYFARLFEREPEFHTDAVTVNLDRIWPLRKEAP